MLGYRQGNAGNVHFLERIGAQHLAGDVAGDADDRNRIQHGGGDAGDQICCSGPAGGDGHAHLARGAGVAVGHVRGALFVADEDVVDGELAQRVVSGQDGPAGIAEDGGDALADEGGPDDFCSG